MKSKFFAFAAVLAFGLMIGATALAYYPGPGGDMPDIHIPGPTDFFSFHFRGRVPCVGPACPGWHPSLPDTDHDTTPDITDTDDDGDGILDVNDNCPLVVNVDQADLDGDDIGDACDDDNDNDRVINADDRCDDSSPDFAVDPDGCTVDTDGDGKTDDIDSCPDVAADTDDGCLAAAAGGGARIGGGNLSDITGDTDDSGVTEEADGGGFCTLIENASSTNALSALILAISLIPLGIRRKIK